MKKNYFFGAVALCGLLAFTSCGNDDDPILDGPGNEVATGEQVIVLDMQDTDVLSTKSRPLYSTDNRGSEDVTDVMLYIFKEETGTQKLIKTIHVDNWDNTCEEYKYGRKRTIKLEGKDKLEAGSTYTIYAVGQNETEVEGNPAPFKFQGAVTAPGDDSWKNIPGLLITNPSNITHNFATTPGSGFPYLLTRYEIRQQGCRRGILRSIQTGDIRTEGKCLLDRVAEASGCRCAGLLLEYPGGWKCFI